MKTIEIELPLLLHDSMMTSNRIFSNITEIAGVIKSDLSVHHLNFSSREVTRYGLGDIKKPTEFNYRKISINPKFNMNDEILFINSGYNKLGTLTKANVTEIQFNISIYSNIFWFKAKGKNLPINEIFSNINDFANRTKPQKNLSENEKYIFTNYCIEQNKLVNVEVAKVSETHFKIIKGYQQGKIIRGSYLHNSHESFINKMTCSL